MHGPCSNAWTMFCFLNSPTSSECEEILRRAESGKRRGETEGRGRSVLEEDGGGGGKRERRIGHTEVMEGTVLLEVFSGFLKFCPL